MSEVLIFIEISSNLAFHSVTPHSNWILLVIALGGGGGGGGGSFDASANLDTLLLALDLRVGPRLLIFSVSIARFQLRADMVRE